MTIKQQGGVFGRNPTFNTVTVNGDASFQEASFNTTADGVVVDVQKNDATAGGLGVDSGDLIIGTADTGLRFLDSSDAILPWDFVGNAGNNGVIDLGNSSNRFADIHLAGNVIIGTSGKGIDFSATSGTGTSELFDDYEEGTWTPVIADATTGGNTGTGSVSGLYTKIGDTVFLQGWVINADTTGMTAGNSFYIRGLPFSANSSSLHRYCGSVITTGVSFTQYLVPWVNAAESAFRISDVTVGNIAVSAVASGTADFFFTLTYKAS